MRPQVVHFLRRHLEGEIGRETVLVALECLIELLRRDTIDLGKIGIQDDPLLAEGEDGRLVRGFRFHLAKSDFKIVSGADVALASAMRKFDSAVARAASGNWRPSFIKFRRHIA